MAEIESNVHINAPELLTAQQRARDTVITAAMWVFYLYLWVPAISLFAWVLGFELAYDIMVREGGAGDLGEVLRVYGAIVGIIFFVVTAWSLFNRVRFRGMTRRGQPPPPPDESLADYFGVTMDGLRTMRSSKTVRVDFDPEGRPKLPDDD